LLEGFREEGVDCVALDLRNNGGGSLPESISLTGLFIDTGPVVQIKDADQRVQQYDDLEPGVVWDGPLVVLVNKFSASASEIVAGAIQDYRRGLVIGDSATHGKGTVQSLLDLGRQLFQRLPNAPSLGALKITMQQFYRPSGLSTQMEGVKSDVQLPSITDHLPVGESDLDNAIPFDRVGKADFTATNDVNESMLETLQQRSTVRVADDEEFQELATDIARYEERKNEKTLSLLESDFVREWNEGKAADKEEEEKQEENAGPRRPVVRRDFYFDEAMRVTTDYLSVLSGAVMPSLVNSESNTQPE
jgi:carboxyl-terminal processing protease